jgi:hypothetical protein
VLLSFEPRRSQDTVQIACQRHTTDGTSLEKVGF